MNIKKAVKTAARSINTLPTSFKVTKKDTEARRREGINSGRRDNETTAQYGRRRGKTGPIKQRDRIVGDVITIAPKPLNNEIIGGITDNGNKIDAVNKLINSQSPAQLIARGPNMAGGVLQDVSNILRDVDELINPVVDPNIEPEPIPEPEKNKTALFVIGGAVVLIVIIVLLNVVKKK